MRDYDEPATPAKIEGKGNKRQKAFMKRERNKEGKAQRRRGSGSKREETDDEGEKSDGDGSGQEAEGKGGADGKSSRKRQGGDSILSMLEDMEGKRMGIEILELYEFLARTPG